MKKIKEFKKRGCLTITFGQSNLLGYCVVIKDKNEVKSMYTYDTMHEALEMFWYFIADQTNLSKYIQ